MSNCNALCAQTIGGGYHTFNLCDAPTVVDNEHFVLLNVQGSPIMLTDSVRAGSDIQDVFEGSVIKTPDEKEYTVSFKRGFAAMDVDHNVYKLHELSPFVVLEGKVSVFSFCRAKLSYKYEDVLFKFGDIIGTIDGTAFITNKRIAIDFSKVQQFAGLTVGDKRVYFGDVIKGRTVVMHLGRVCFYDGEVYTDITDGEVIPEWL